MIITPLAVFKKLKDTVWLATERAIVGFHETFNHTEKTVPHYDEKGVLQYSDRLVDGKLAERIFYHANGAVAMRNPYRDGVRHGLGKRYDQQHGLTSTCLVDQGQIVEVCHFSAGKLVSYVPYSENTKNGTERNYDKNEHLRETIDWRHGVRQEKTFFAADGFYAKTKYVDGKPVEPVKWYAPNGTLSRSEYADRTIGYHANGRVSHTEPKQNGVRHGEALYYTEQGDPRVSYMYANGKREGKSIMFYPDGSWTKRMFKNDLPLDPVSSYDKDGKLTGRLYKDRSIRFDDDGTELIIPYDDKGEYHGYEIQSRSQDGHRETDGCLLPARAIRRRSPLLPSV